MSLPSAPKPPVCPSSCYLHPSLQGDHPPGTCHYRSVLPGLELPTKGSTWCVLSAWPLRLNVTSGSFVLELYLSSWSLITSAVRQPLVLPTCTSFGLPALCGGVGGEVRRRTRLSQSKPTSFLGHPLPSPVVSRILSYFSNRKP